MRLASILLATAAFAGAFFSMEVAAQDKPLPWDGRAYDLTVPTLTEKYMTHILTMKGNSTDADPAKYVTIDQQGRSPEFNGDTGVISIGVDEKAIFKVQNNFRRSELVQMIAGDVEGTTFFRVSFKKDEAWLNKYAWQCIFPESHIFEIRIDASATPPAIILYTGGTWDTKWTTEFKLSTWYNFGIAVSKSEITLYESEGDEPLKWATTEPNTEAPSSYEFHFGMLILSDDGSDPVMVEGQQDVLDYNGVSVEAGIPADVVKSSAAGSASASAATTEAPVDEASDADDDASSAADVDDEYDEYDEEPASTSAAPAVTSTTPVSCNRRK